MDNDNVKIHPFHIKVLIRRIFTRQREDSNWKIRRLNVSSGRNQLFRSESDAKDKFVRYDTFCQHDPSSVRLSGPLSNGQCGGQPGQIEDTRQHVRAPQEMGSDADNGRDEPKRLP